MYNVVRVKYSLLLANWDFVFYDLNQFSFRKVGNEPKPLRKTLDNFVIVIYDFVFASYF